MDFLHVWKKSWITFLVVVSWGRTRWKQMCTRVYQFLMMICQDQHLLRVFLDRHRARDQDHSTATQESPWLLLLGRYLSKLSGNSAAFWAWLFIPSLSLSVGSTRSCSSLNFYRKRKRFPFFFVKLSDFSTMIQSASFFLFADSYILQWNTTVVVDQPVVKIVWNFVAMSNYIKIMLDCYCGLGLC